MDGVLGADTVQLSLGNASFADPAVGTNKPVTFTGFSIGGAGRAITGSISLRPRHITGRTDAHRSRPGQVYDGSDTATYTGGTLVGILGDDDVTLVAGTAQFSDADVGTDKVISFTGFSLSGADAGLYTLTAPADTTADITSLALQISGLTTNDKVYDGTVAATFAGGVLNGVLPGDVVVLQSGTASFADALVGGGKTVLCWLWFIR